MITATKRTSLWLDGVLILVLLVATLAVRIPIAAERKIMPAGDVFNFQNITEKLIHLTYPRQENRLPGYPILILLTRPLPVDPVQAAIGISVVMSGFTLVCLYLLGRTLHLHRVPLMAILGLSIFDPLLTVNAVRPLADTTFIFWVYLFLLLMVRELIKKPPSTHRAHIVIGLVTTMMMFTRFEGVSIAIFTLPLLWLKVPWRQVLLACLIPLIAGVLWLPVHRWIHGSLTGGYVAALLQPSEDFGNIHAAPGKLLTLVRSAGWGKAWDIPKDESVQEPQDEAAVRVFTNPAWWLSLLAILGLPWLLIRQGQAALPLLTMVVGYTAILMWWFIYSRFVTPLVPIFYFTAAAGGSFLITATQSLIQEVFGVAIFRRLRKKSRM